MKKDKNNKSDDGDENKTENAAPMHWVVHQKPTLGVDNSGASSSVWLVSFTDVIALMLTFFVLLYAMSDPVVEKWEAKTGMPLYNTASYSGPAQQAGQNEGVNINRLDYNRAEDLDYVQAVLREILDENILGTAISVDRVGDALRLSVSDRLAFDENGSDLNADSMVLLRRLAPVLDSLNNSMAIVGSLQNDDRGEMFAKLQGVSKAMKDSRYTRPIMLEVNGDGETDAGRIYIVMEPHDGRRIVR